jgi:hydrogenase nickel incorporation protein HypA/HybF
MTRTLTWIHHRCVGPPNRAGHWRPNWSAIDATQLNVAIEGRRVMHEQALSQALLEAVKDRAGGRLVTGVRARIGACWQVDRQALAEAFEAASTGTVAEGASLDVIVTPPHGTCRVCGQTYTEVVPLVCAECGAAAVESAGGHTLVLEAITVPWWEVTDEPPPSGTTWLLSEAESSGPSD